MPEDLREAALHYHRSPTAGKIEVTPTKPLSNQRDLALAYSPGVAAACEAIVADPAEAGRVTSRANLVAVVTNGTAVLGLGAIGPLAAKPVMEGKGVLFKKFAGIDVFDIEIDERDPERFVEIVASLEPTFGGINLEDIKAPECFEIERRLRERMRIPVFHDDQHGTAIIVAAAVLNALRVVEKRIEEVRLVASGAGAAGLACLDLLVSLGLRREHVIVCDRHGVIHRGREADMDPRKAEYAADTEARTLGEAIVGADIFLGLSAPGVLTQEMVARMAERPIILALANPVPEILPEEAKAVRPDAIIATGRSDYPNQVNNVLCFPFIFRGALDVGATTINEAMKIACVKAIANLALAEPSDIVVAAYGGQSLRFGPDYLIPKPFDPRLIVEIAPAVARAAMETGVATRPIEDFRAYRERLQQFVFKSGLVMKPIFECAKQDPKRIAFAEGEEPRVLQAVSQIVAEGLARPILIGRPSVIRSRIEQLGLRLVEGEHYELVNILDHPEYKSYWQQYHRIMERRGVSPDYARKIVRTRQTVIAALMVLRGAADALICGTTGRFHRHLKHVIDVLGRRPGVRQVATMNVLVLKQGTFFIADTYVNADPDAEEIAEITMLAAEEVQRFGIHPKVALLSHSNFGTSEAPSAQKMREALKILMRRAPHLEVEGEMHADAALSEAIRARIFPNSRLHGTANLLIMPTVDAANIAYNLLKVLGDGVAIGPILLGCAHPAHVLTPSATVRRIVNAAALAVVDAQLHGSERALVAV
ncbi:NADP-dependent malic enzyme [Inmirania thermothiophila]|uniref:NADP-dependent malic enzyme n=1 Tax=Inmirania thermothiophila TaxID=1750597 RepID=A0A3N1Y2Q7_9GAMM|nr:NADP-dependent malic enzyme [Inmirania thermothiophila]ROR32821.1 malate dehydrogenase (oxaloacetate-decarboxylating)(NADP+) [Inmirania thermothiophila]